MQERVLELAMVLGKREESAQLSHLCAVATEELEQRLKDGITPEDCGKAFPLAAAWLALARLYEREDEVERLTAGDVTVHRGDGIYRRKALELQAEQVMKPYIKDRGFTFMGVKG